jgi:hypothetical protein
MDEKLMGAKRFAQLFGGFEYRQDPPEKQSPSRRHHSAELAPAMRVKSDQEVVVGLAPDDAADECRRCLRCDVRG